MKEQLFEEELGKEVLNPKMASKIKARKRFRLHHLVMIIIIIAIVSTCLYIRKNLG